MQLSEKGCLHITATIWSHRHQSQISHGIHKLLRNPYARVVLIPPQEWSVLNAIPPFWPSVIFQFFSLYFYQVYCFCLGSCYVAELILLHYLNSCKLSHKSIKFFPVYSHLQLSTSVESTFLLVHKTNSLVLGV